MKLIIGIIILMELVGCGKKVDDSGPQFGLELRASQENLKEGLIIRTDENSGPSYSLSSINIQSIDYIDKKLICGTLTINAKRTLNSDPEFQTFKISEAEFHGLNQLPQQPRCTLQLTAGNKAGSTLTKNIPVTFKFDSGPPLAIPRSIAGIGHYDPYIFRYKHQLVLDSFEISNPLPYDISLQFNPVFAVQVWGEFTSNVTPGLKSCSQSARNISISKVEFEPSIEYTGSPSEGYFFKVKAGQSVRLLALGNIPDQWIGSRSTSLGDYHLTTLTVATVSGLELPTLFLAKDFEINPRDSESVIPANIPRTMPHNYMKPYNFIYNPALNNCPRNPDL